MDLSEFSNNNSVNCLLQSLVSDTIKTEECMLGIDEAGRGPVLGPMVYSVAFCPVSSLEKLKELKFADSKTLNEAKREELFTLINDSESIGWKTEILSPNYISNSMLRRSKYNLNAISHDCAMRLIQKVIDDGINVTQAYIDTVGDPKKYQEKLSSVFPDIKVTVEKKADANFPIVSAASICAKVARDTALKNWKFQEGSQFSEVNFGSGYTSDPTTKTFMAENIDTVFGYPQFVRFSWSTADVLLQKKAVKVVWSDDEDEEKTPSVTSYFGKNKNKISVGAKSSAKCHPFYKECGIRNISSL